MHDLSRKSTGVDYDVMMLSLTTAVLDVKTFMRFASAFVKTAFPCAKLLF
jgi:hypothetical protein